MKRFAFFAAASLGALGFVLVTAWTVLAGTKKIALFNVPTNAMATFVCAGDQIVVEALSLHGRVPVHGEVVAFTTAGISSIYMSSSSPVIYIKRVVGHPGDRLSFADGKLLINGSTMAGKFDTTSHPYQPFGLLSELKEFIVPDEHLFVMGDNSANSSDSRYWGPLPFKNLQFTYWFHLRRASVRTAKLPPRPGAY